MRFMLIVKGNADTEKIVPSAELLTAMGNFNEEMVKAGVMVDGGGLHPSTKDAARVRFSGRDKRSVVDGPFVEAKELIGGYWIIDVKSLEEAVEWVKKVPSDNPEGVESEIEIRRLFEAADFGEEFTPELREQEESQRERIEGQQK